MFTLFLRAVFLYLVVIAVIRLLGKRQLGQLEPSEVAVTMLIADLASFPMQETGISILSGIVPILAVLGMEVVLSFLSMRNIKIRKMLCGKPVILMENGRFLQENMRKNRVTLDELISQLRQNNVIDPSVVQYAILETGGNLSVFVRGEERPATAKEAGITPQPDSLPVTIISDGRILEENLHRAGKDTRWLQKILSKEKLTPRETFLLTVDSDNKISVFPKE
ncbi:MAG: DUF421 domain-containing protein [Oscillospiraceae bacterium]|nr:DUF421 domain-containing protein [Oscillospiraceae bacterium]